MTEKKARKGDGGSGCNPLVKMLKEYQGVLTRQQIKTIKGQILAGNVTEAMRGLNGILEKEMDDRLTDLIGGLGR